MEEDFSYKNFEPDQPELEQPDVRMAVASEGEESIDSAYVPEQCGRKRSPTKTRTDRPR